MTGINKKQMFGIFAFCVAAMSSNMTMGVIAYIMQSYSNVAPTTVSQILTMPALVGTAYAFCVGVLHKKIPAKYLMLFSQFCLFVYGMIFLFLGGSAPIWVLMLASGLVGISQGSCNTLLAIALSEAVTDPNKRGGILGISMAVMNIGGVFFSTVGGMLAVNRWNDAYCLYFIVAVTLVIQMICLPKGAMQTSPTPAGGEHKKSSGRLPLKVWIISAHYFIFFLALYVYGTNISEYIITTYKLGTSAEAGVAASMVTVGGIAAGALFGLYSKFLKKFTVPVLMGFCVIGLVIPIVVTTNVWALFFCGLILGFAMSGCNPYIMEYLREIAPGEQYSKAMSIFSGFMNGGMCVAITVLAFITGLVCGDPGHVPTKFIVGAVLACVAFVASFPIYVTKE